QGGSDKSWTYVCSHTPWKRSLSISSGPNAPLSETFKAPETNWCACCKADSSREPRAMMTFPSREPVKAGRDDSSSPDLDAYIEDFETAWAQRGEADLADFLPSRDSPLYLEILCELIRVDLELRWQKGSPRSLDYYERAFPEAFAKSETRGQIVFEERR